ncbi:hypothetical protein QL285_047711 [Trifolium repens]|nr:hypothetical protein QL285_047711 [Trifolium repens]
MAASVSYSPSLSLVLQRNTNSSFSATFSLFDDEAQTVLSLRRDLNTTNPYHGRFSFRFFKSFLLIYRRHLRIQPRLETLFP